MPALPSLRQLSYLVALAEHRNFTRAAHACFVTQSTLSAGLQELEQLLDARLVERDRRHVALTPVGEGVVERARALLAQAEDLVEHATREGRPMAGLARLGAIPTIAPFLLPSLLRTMRERHPALKLALREDQTARLLERVRDATVDFALIALPYDTDGLLVRELFDEPLWLIGAEGDPALRRAHPPIDGVDPERLLLLEEGHCLREHVLEGCRLPDRPNAAGLEATSLVTLVHMVAEGLGVALLPEMAVHSGLLDGTEVVARSMAAPAPVRRIALVARPTTARIEAFEALAAAVMAVTRARTPRPPASSRRKGAAA